MKFATIMPERLSLHKSRLYEMSVGCKLGVGSREYVMEILRSRKGHNSFVRDKDYQTHSSTCTMHVGDEDPRSDAKNTWKSRAEMFEMDVG